MPLADYVLTIALGGAFALGLMFIVMRREAQVNLQSGMSAEGLLQQHSGMGFGKAKRKFKLYGRKMPNSIPIKTRPIQIKWFHFGIKEFR